MALLKSLKLSPYNPTNRNNSFLKRRRKLIAKIDEQILLVTDSNYKPTKIKWIHNEYGVVISYENSICILSNPPSNLQTIY